MHVEARMFDRERDNDGYFFTSSCRIALVTNDISANDGFRHGEQ